jgi:hypothetical protein
LYKYAEINFSFILLKGILIHSIQQFRILRGLMEEGSILKTLPSLQKESHQVNTWSQSYYLIYNYIQRQFLAVFFKVEETCLVSKRTISVVIIYRVGALVGLWPQVNNLKWVLKVRKFCCPRRLMAGDLIKVKNIFKS